MKHKVDGLRWNIQHRIGRGVHQRASWARSAPKTWQAWIVCACVASASIGATSCAEGGPSESGSDADGRGGSVGRVTQQSTAQGSSPSTGATVVQSAQGQGSQGSQASQGSQGSQPALSAAQAPVSPEQGQRDRQMFCTQFANVPTAQPNANNWYGYALCNVPTAQLGCNTWSGSTDLVSCMQASYNWCVWRGFQGGLGTLAESAGSASVLCLDWVRDVARAVSFDSINAMPGGWSLDPSFRMSSQTIRFRIGQHAMRRWFRGSLMNFVAGSEENTFWDSVPAAQGIGPIGVDDRSQVATAFSVDNGLAVHVRVFWDSFSTWNTPVAQDLRANCPMLQPWEMMTTSLSAHQQTQTTLACSYAVHRACRAAMDPSNASQVIIASGNPSNYQDLRVPLQNRGRVQFHAGYGPVEWSNQDGGVSGRHRWGILCF